jgi:hypothetical protein
MTQEERKDLFLLYLSVNQIQIELIDRLGGLPIFRQNLKRHLKEAQKIMIGHANHVFEKDSKDGMIYNSIVKMGDSYVNSVEQKGFDHVYAILKAIENNEIKLDNGD